MSTSTKRKETYINPLNSSDNPDQLLSKLKSISEFTSDINIDSESLSKENSKQILALLDTLTQKFLVDSLKEHSQLKLILSCCLVDLIRILGPRHNQIQNKSHFILTNIIETLKASHKLSDPHYFPQFHYFLQHFDKSQGVTLLGLEKLWEVSRDFVKACFEAVDALQNQPEIYSRIQQIIISALENAKSTMKDDIVEELVFPILLVFEKTNKKTRKFDLAKVLIKEMSWNLRQLSGKICMDIFKRRGIYRSINPSLSIERVCYMIQCLFKIDYEIIRAIWPYLESEINVSSKREIRKTYLTLLGKICASKLSHVSTTCPQIFNYFVETLTSKKNKTFRQTLLGLAFKYIRNFTYCKTVSEFEISTSTVKYDVYQKNLTKLEAKIKELLYEGDDENKAFILEKIRTLSLENPRFISQELLKDVSTLLWYLQEKKKGSILELLSDIYIQYCCTLYDEDIYDFEARTGNFELVNGVINTIILQRKEVGKTYLWIAETLILFFHHNSKASFWTLHAALIKVFGLHTLPTKGIAKRLLGFYFNLWSKKYKGEISDTKFLKYPEFIQKKLKYNWFTENEILAPDFYFLRRGITKIFKICHRLHYNFISYLKALIEDNEQKLEDCRNYITTYYSFSRPFPEIEKEFKEYLQKEEFSKNLRSLLNTHQPFQDKQELARTISRGLESADCKFFLETASLNIFDEQVSEKLAGLISLIVQRDRDHSVLIQEGSLSFSLYLMKRNISDGFKKNQNEIASYLSEHIETIVNQAKNADQTKPLEVFAYNNYAVSVFELLSLLDLQSVSSAENNFDLEGLKYYLVDLLSKLVLPNKQAKYAARIVVSLDKVTSEKVTRKIVYKMLPHLEIKSPALLSTLRTFSELLKVEKESFIDNIDDLNKFFYSLISEPIALPKEGLIAELSQCKKVLLKIMFNNYFMVDHAVVNDQFNRGHKDLKHFLLQLLLNFNDICAGFMRSDKDYLRIYILDCYLEIVAKEGSVEFDSEAFAKIGLLCYDDNDDIKKYLFTCVMYKRNRTTSPLNYIYSLYSFFLYSSEDPNLKHIAEDTFNKEMAMISQGYLSLLQRTSAEDISRSAEYLLIYLIFLMCNNPLLLLKVKVLSYSFYKCLDHFVHTLEKTKNPHKEEYVMEILYTLKRYNPIVYEECSTTTIEFTDLKKRKAVKKALKKGESKESQELVNLTFQDVIDVMISHFRGAYSLPNVEKRRLPVPIPGKLFRLIGQEGSAKDEMKDERRSSLRLSAPPPVPQQTEVKAPKDLTPPSSAKSIELVKRLDFTGEELRPKETINPFDSEQRKRYEANREVVPSFEEREESKERNKKEEEEKEKGGDGSEKKEKEESKKEEMEIEKTVPKSEDKEEERETRASKHNAAAAEKGKKGKGKSVEEPKKEKANLRNQIKTKEEKVEGSQGDKGGKEEVEFKKFQKKGVKGKGGSKEQIGSQQGGKEESKQGSQKEEQKKTRGGKKEVEVETENSRVTRSKAQKTKRKEDELPPSKKVKRGK